MIHYHGTPITPNAACEAALRGGHALVSFEHAHQLPIVQEQCQSFCLDNGAFSAWRQGRPTTDWTDYVEWADEHGRHPACDFVIVPDVIDGDETANDALIAWWPLPKRMSAPVWHVHESVERLLRLLEGDWNRVCLGSSGEFSDVGTPKWWDRMSTVMNTICRDGVPPARLHGLRMLDQRVFTKLPLASADSTTVARRIGLDSEWTGSYQPLSKEMRAQVMRHRIESFQSAARWTPRLVQTELGLF
jgi:hypothetical protein